MIQEQSSILVESNRILEALFHHGYVLENKNDCTKKPSLNICKNLIVTGWFKKKIVESNVVSLLLPSYLIAVFLILESRKKYNVLCPNKND